MVLGPRRAPGSPPAPATNSSVAAGGWSGWSDGSDGLSPTGTGQDREGDGCPAWYMGTGEGLGVKKEKVSVLHWFFPPLEFLVGNDLQGEALGVLC